MASFHALYEKCFGRKCSCSKAHAHRAEVSFAADAVISRKKRILGVVACLLSLPLGANAEEVEKESRPPMERVRVKGVASKVADEVSGTKVNYLNKESNFGPLGKVELKKVPFSVMQTGHDVLENEQVRTMDEAFEYMPSVQLQKYATPSPQMVNRGYQADIVANSRIDGFNVRLGSPYTSEQFQSMTVLNGAAGSMYGPESPSGVVDMVLKRPTKSPFFNFNFGYDSNGAPLESLDTSLGKGPVKLRFNYLNQTGQSYVSTSDMWRNLYSADIDIQLTKRIKFELDAGQYNVGYYGMPAGFAYSGDTALPDAPDPTKAGYGQNQGGYTASSTYGMEKLFIDISPHWKLKLGGSYDSSTRHLHTITNTLYNAGSSGCLGAGVVGEACYSQVMAASKSNNYDGVWSNYAYLNGDFHIGPITHHINLGTNGYNSTLTQPNFAQASRDYGITGLNNPIVQPLGYVPKQYGGNHEGSMTQQQAFIFGDSMDIGKQFTIMGQFSESWITEANYAKAAPYGKSGGTSANGVFSPSVGFTFHPRTNLNFYFNWGNSIQPGPEAPGNTANENAILSPVRSWQYEGGVKYTWRKRLQINLDGFSMSRPYAFSNPDNMVDGLPVYGYYGAQNDYGIEYQMSGALTKDISIYGGFTWDHARLTDTGNPLSSDKKVTGVPEWASDFSLDWHPVFLHGVAFNSNIHYVGTRQANVYNTTQAGEYVTLNLGVRYATQISGHKLVVRGNVDNVTGQNYWDSAFADSTDGAAKGATYSAVLGTPRTWRITASVYF
ncbi:TonB-dependent siderophore receptor [Acetobacteraceae bacterium]|nr:TonB-dependent siderophore receptor [Acetobacteraceae bacterium]